MFTNLKHLHFIGICGTAMGAVAAALRDQGYTVTGSDEDVYPPMSTFLEEKGIVLNRGYKAENLPASAELIVVGNAIRRGQPGSRRSAQLQAALLLAAGGAQVLLPARTP